MKHICLILIVFATTLAASAQDLSFSVEGRVCDEETHAGIPEATIQLLRADSTVLKKFELTTRQDTMMFRFFARYQFEVDELGKYFVRASHVNYETVYVPVVIKSKRQHIIEVPEIRMKKVSQMLDEVVVKATKVKMVMHGDTVVFNADAFNLAEGSMLDALIAQLPGTELSQDGEIKVNGRRVESLLVDGRSFFEGDPKAALQNLPAYTVNKVKVFERKGKLTEMMGRDMDDEVYVMDVRLKKEFQLGMMGNFELGGGTDRHYKTKMLVTLTNKKSRLSVIGNVNNLSDGVDLMQGIVVSSFGGTMNPVVDNGVTTYRKGGISYSYGEFTDPFSLSWRTNLNHNSVHTDTWTSSQTFLTGGDTYSRNANYSRNRDIRLENAAHMQFSPKGFVGNVDGQFNFTKNKGWNSAKSAIFDADPNQYNNILDDLFVNPEKYRTFTLNRQRSESERSSSGVNASLNFYGNVKMLADVIGIHANTSYAHTSSENFSLSVYDYMKRQGMQDYRNNYGDSPNTNFSASLGASYVYGLGRHSIGVEYNYTYQYNKTNNLLYRLDKLNGRDSSNYKMLPSAYDELRQVLDSPNSYIYSQFNNRHGIDFTFLYRPIFLKDGGVTLTLPLTTEHQKLSYFRVVDTHLSQTNTFLNPQLRIEYTTNENKNNQSYGLDMSINTSAPDLTSRIDYRDDSNPLVVTLGNPNLKNSHVYTAGVFARFFSQKMSRHSMININYSQMDNARASSMVYDRQSGITTTQPVNINGNWNAAANVNYGQNITKNSLWSFNARLSASYNHSVDLTQVANGQDAHFEMTQVKSNVNNRSIGTGLSVIYMPMNANKGRGMCSVFFDGSLNHTTGDREGFNRIHAGDFNYGARAVTYMFWDLQLNSSITNYCHRGYSDAQMNRDELVWNMTLSKHFPKLNLTVAAETFDLLGKLSNRRFTVNEQGRTETYSNVTPRYFMLKLTYRFNKFPKNKKPGIMFPFGMGMGGGDIFRWVRK